MIYYGTLGQVLPSMIVKEMSHQAAVVGIYRSAPAGSGMPPVEIHLTEDDVVSYQPQPKLQNSLEQFDWSDKATSRGFVRLEQKVLAQVAEPDEISRYQAMKQHRNSKAFAERQLRDYEEIRRLKQLSKKLSELQQYMRPIKV